MSATSLVTTVTFYPVNPAEATLQERDVPVEVYANTVLDTSAILWFGHPIVGNQVRVELSGAERIALIEALGGTA